MGDGCQGLPEEIGPVMPDFRLKPPELVGNTGTGGVVAVEKTPEIIVAIPDDKSCPIFSLIAAEIPNANSFCGCTGPTSLSCYYTDICQDGRCADTVEVLTSITTGVNVKYCTEWRDDMGFQLTCADLEIGFDQMLSGCNGASYGGKQCKCKVCSDNLSLDIDCSEHDPYAKTDGCQGLPEEVGPVIPAFQLKPSSLTTNGGVSSTTSTFGGGDTSCPLYNYLSDRITDIGSICGCDDDEVLNCRKQDVCAINDDGLQSYRNNGREKTNTCSDYVDVSIDIGDTDISVENCVTFDKDTANYEKTCATISILLGTKSGINFDRCSSATYGDDKNNRCLCRVCNDKESVEIDCSEYNPLAKTPGCQKIETVQLTPFVPNFNSDGSDENVDRSSASCSLLNRRHYHHYYKLLFMIVSTTTMIVMGIS